MVARVLLAVLLALAVLPPAGPVALAQAGSVGGAAFFDTNSDGLISDGSVSPLEPVRLAGVAVSLIRSSGASVGSTTTAADGTYSFTGLTPGDYIVRAVLAPGYGASSPTSVPFTISGTTGQVVDFAMTKGAFGNFVWDDLNRNGVQDSGEPGIAGITVRLLDGQGAVVQEQATNATGEYYFVGVEEGTYRVRVVAPPYKVFTRPNAGTRGTGSVFDPVTGLSEPMVVEIVDSGITQDLTVDAGLFQRVEDLAVTLTADRPEPVVGEQVELTAVVGNAGSVPVSGAQVTVTVPEGLAIGEVAGGWTCPVVGRDVVCGTRDVVAAGAALPPVRITATAERAGPVSATALVRRYNGNVDDNAANDGATTTVTVLAPAVTTTAPPAATTTTTAPPAPPTTAAPPMAGDGDLALTGRSVGVVALGGLGLLLLGFGAHSLSRRRGI
ncbi:MULTISPECIES: SdrD B-like domain-containing protein [Actinosynnema]|uniref:SdrD B-like domain-containing protein n=1 Tax=Actinosynnema TaxID=40566 RepID=UPI0020A378EC|nr:SdrD B-like domain-containing protein [Actinosynnema pretiosum]MCP2094547.1 conserved repeat domain-containing protein [Actinosynnema pretiosum]